MRSLLLAASLLLTGLAVPTASAGVVGFVDDTCDDLHPAIECLLACNELFVQLYTCYVVDDIPFPPLAASSGPVRTACDLADVRESCERLLIHCRGTDPLTDAFCRDVYNPLVDSL